jgi:hypothetical protein
MREPHALPRTVDGLEFQEAGPDLLVHDPAARKIHVLNASAGRVLRLCDGAHPVSEIIDAVAIDGVDRALVERDVDRILTEFERLGLLVR